MFLFDKSLSLLQTKSSGGKRAKIFMQFVRFLKVGATSCYIPEEGISLKKLQDDVNHFIRRFGDDEKGVSSGRLILR